MPRAIPPYSSQFHHSSSCILRGNSTNFAKFAMSGLFLFSHTHSLFNSLNSSNSSNSAAAFMFGENLAGGAIATATGGGSLAAAPRCEAPAYARTNWGKPRFPPDPYPGGLCHHQSSMQALEMKPMKNTCDRPPRAMNESLIPAFSFCRQEAFRKKHKPPRGF